MNDGCGAPRRNDKAVVKALVKLWYFCACICDKRLAPAIATMLPVRTREERDGRKIGHLQGELVGHAGGEVWLRAALY